MCGLRMRIARSALLGCGGECCEILHHGSRSDQYHSAQRWSQQRTYIQGTFDRWFDRTCDPVDSRRNVRERIIYVNRKSKWQPLQRKQAFWKLNRVQPAIRTMPGVSAAQEKFPGWFTARGRARSR